MVAVGTSFYSPATDLSSEILRVEGSDVQTMAIPNEIGLSSLYGTWAASPADVWAVGAAVFGPSSALLLHFDGQAWSAEVAPNESGAYLAVDGTSPSDVWVAGTQGHTAIMEHWNGTKWSDVSMPRGVISNYQPGGSELSGIEALKPGAAWAVGRVFVGPEHAKPLLLVWNGARWSETGIDPNPGTSAWLEGIWGASSTDAWAVGASRSDPTKPCGVGSPGLDLSEKGANAVDHFCAESPLMVHWDGTEWRSVGVPAPWSDGCFLNSVDGSSANDVWAVGGCTSATGRVGLLEHWDGRRWTIVSAPSLDGHGATFSSVSVASSSSAWVVGSVASPSIPDNPLIGHWNGHRWTRVDSSDSASGSTESGSE